MKKIMLLVCLSFSLISFAQSKKEQRIIDRTNEFVASVENNLDNVTEEEKTKFFEIKKEQIEAFWDMGKNYEKGTDEFKAKRKEVITIFREKVFTEFGKQRGRDILKASLAYMKK